MAKKSRLILPLTDKDINRFWSKIQKRRWNQCWDWQGKKARYGTFYLRGGYVGAHRIAYTVATGKDPSDSFVSHTCTNKSVFKWTKFSRVGAAI